MRCSTLFLLLFVAAVCPGCSSPDTSSSDTSSSETSAPDPNPAPAADPGPEGGASTEAPVADMPAPTAQGDDDDSASKDGSAEAADGPQGTEVAASSDSADTEGEPEVVPAPATPSPAAEKGQTADMVPDPAGGGPVEPPSDPGKGVEGYGHPSTATVLAEVAALMAGTRFRWLQGTRDVAAGFYGSPLLFNIWSCGDEDIDDTISWLRSLEEVYADNMVGVLVPANVAERSLTGQDNMCGRSVRMARSHGVDVGKSIKDKLGPKTLPATYVFDEEGRVVESYFGPISAGSKPAKKLEGAFKTLMEPLLKARRDAL
ncbi:MAG: hypothetical protein CL928_19150 [Deltaproteobacteria bacterium]|nr:hypothetical protein [Deltaproteobacteria bacterium]